MDEDRCSLAVLLVAMGFDVLSMNASTLLKVKSVTRSITLETAQDLLEQVMKMDDAQTIRSAVDLALYNTGVDRLLRSFRTNWIAFPRLFIAST